MKKTATKRRAGSSKKVSPKKINPSQFLKQLRRPRIIATSIVLAVLAGLVFMLPDSAPISLASLTGKGTDRVAPKLDTLSGNYSVAGEAASTSLLVKYKASVSQAARDSANQRAGGRTEHRVDRLGVDVVRVESSSSVSETIDKYKSQPEVEYVEPNYLAKHFLTPNDNLFSKQWQLQKVEAPVAWDASQGGYGPIAIIDTGIMSSQTDLSGQVLTGYNFVHDNNNTNDDNGHGTHVAGIVAASTNNGTGVSSIGFKGSLLPVKVLDSTGAGTYGDVASGIVYATDKGARIINLSLGGSSSSRALEDAIKYAISKGAIVVAAAGNNGNNSIVYPAAYPGVIAVSASAQDDSLASFSSYGNNVYISAPGVDIISTYNSGGYATLSGTSMAAPMVSGLIGLAMSRGTTSTSTVLQDLKTSSDKVGSYGYDANGWNPYFGFGRINAAKLLGVATPPAEEPAPAEPESPVEKPQNARAIEAARGRSSARVPFNTVLEGTIDSISQDGSLLVIKVKASADNLQLRTDNLVDLYLESGTSFKSGGDNISLSDLKPGDELTIKAWWADNRLSAQEIRLNGRPVNAGNGRGRSSR